MKASILLTLILFKSLLIDPANAAALTGRHEWDCVDNVLFNEQVMKTLLGMNEEDCLEGLPDPAVLFRHIKFSENPSDDFETRLLEIPLTLENLGIGATSPRPVGSSKDNFVDDSRNSALDEFQLDPNFDDRTSKPMPAQIQEVHVDLGINREQTTEEEVVEIEENDDEFNFDSIHFSEDFEERLAQMRNNRMPVFEINDDFKRPEIITANVQMNIRDRKEILPDPVKQDVGVEEPEVNMTEEPDIKLNLKVESEVQVNPTAAPVEQENEDDDEIEAPLFASEKPIDEENPFADFKASEIIEDQKNRPVVQPIKSIEPTTEEKEEYVPPFNELDTSKMVEENSRPVQHQPKTSQKESNTHISQPNVDLNVNHKQSEEVFVEEIPQESEQDEDDFNFSDIEINQDLFKREVLAPIVIEDVKLNIVKADRVMDIIYDPQTAKKEQPLSESKPDIEASEVPTDSISQSNVHIEEPNVALDIDHTTQEHKEEVIEGDLNSSSEDDEFNFSDFEYQEIKAPVVPTIDIIDETREYIKQEITMNIRDPILKKEEVIQPPTEEETKPEIKKSDESLAASESVVQINQSEPEPVKVPTVEQLTDILHVEEPNVTVDVKHDAVQEVNEIQASGDDDDEFSFSDFDVDLHLDLLKKIPKIEPIEIVDHKIEIKRDDISINIIHDIKPEKKDTEVPSSLIKSEEPKDEPEPVISEPEIKRSSMANSEVEQPVVEENPFEGLDVSEISKDPISHKNPFHNLKVTELVNEEDKPVVIEEQKPVDIEEDKPVVIEEQKPVVIEEQKPVVIEEQKPVVIEEQKPVVIEEQKPVDIEEQKPVVIEEQKSVVIEEQKPVDIEEEPAVTEEDKPIVIQEPEESTEPFDDMKVTDIAKDAISNKSPFHNLKVTELVNDNEEIPNIIITPPAEVDESDKHEELPISTPIETKSITEPVNDSKINIPEVNQTTENLHVSEPNITVDVENNVTEEIKVSEEPNADDTEFSFSDDFDYTNFHKPMQIESPVIEDHELVIKKEGITINVIDKPRPQADTPIKKIEPVVEENTDLKNSKADSIAESEPEEYDFPFADLTNSEIEKDTKTDPKKKQVPEIKQEDTNIHVSDPIVNVDVDSTKKEEIEVAEVDPIDESDEFSFSYDIKLSDKKYEPIVGPIIEDAVPISIKKENINMNIILNKPENPMTPPINTSQSSIKSSQPQVTVDVKGSTTEDKIEESEPSDISVSDDDIFAYNLDGLDPQKKIFEPIDYDEHLPNIVKQGITVDIPEINKDTPISKDSTESNINNTETVPSQNVDPKINIEVTNKSDIQQSIKVSEPEDEDYNFDTSIDYTRPETKEIVLPVIEDVPINIQRGDFSMNIRDPKKTEEVADDVPKINIIPPSDIDSEIDEDNLGNTEIKSPRTSDKIYHSEPVINVDVHEEKDVSVKSSEKSGKSSDPSFDSFDYDINPKDVPQVDIKDSLPEIKKDNIAVDPKLTKKPESLLSSSDDLINPSLSAHSDDSIPDIDSYLKPSEITVNQNIKPTPSIDPISKLSDSSILKSSEEKPESPSIKKSSDKSSLIYSDDSIKKSSDEPYRPQSSIKSSDRSERPDSKNFIYDNKPTIEINHFGKSKDRSAGSGITRFVVQTSAPRIMPTTIAQSKVSVANEIFRAFPLLHKCVQKALLFCNPNFDKLKSACEAATGRECEVNDFTAKIKCASDEDLINNACYKKCPEGFKDYKYFCLKPTATKRATRAFHGEHLDDSEELYGDKLVVEKCAKYGKFMADFGPDYCKARCPMDFKDRGLFCQKPARFQKQQVHVFSKLTAVRSE